MIPNFNILYRYIRILFSVNSEDNIDDIEKEIVEGLVYKGANLWIMIFAILISSIGLNINSKSVVIASMILSPLMGPVYGISFALASDNKKLIKSSFRNLILIIIVSIIVSAIYFFITPIEIISNELYSFAHPSIFDLIIAFIGGMAGYLAITREYGDKYLIAIAIATSCIPTLCTSGFGIANLNFTLFWGGLFNFILNSFFIFLGSIFFMFFLKGHFKNKLVFRIRIIITLVTFVILGYTFYISGDNVFNFFRKSNIDKSIKELENYNSNTIILKTSYSKKFDSIRIYYVGNEFDTNIKSEIQNKFKKEQLSIEFVKIN